MADEPNSFEDIPRSPEGIPQITVRPPGPRQGTEDGFLTPKAFSPGPSEDPWEVGPQPVAAPKEEPYDPWERVAPQIKKTVKNKVEIAEPPSNWGELGKKFKESAAQSASEAVKSYSESLAGSYIPEGAVYEGANGEYYDKDYQILKQTRKPNVVPLTRDPNTQEIQGAMPGALDVFGNTVSSPAGTLAAGLRIPGKAALGIHPAAPHAPVPPGAPPHVPGPPPVGPPPIHPPGPPMAPPPSAAATAVEKFTDILGQIANDVQMKVAPMAANSGSAEARGIVKDYANTARLNRYNWAQTDEILKKKFSEADLKRMWEAADAESVAIQATGHPQPGVGLSTLSPLERAVVASLQRHAEGVWNEAVAVGIVKGPGVASYTPRMFTNVASSAAVNGRQLDLLGGNVATTTGNLRKRKYFTSEQTEAAGKAKLGAAAELAKNIRTLPLAISRLENAVAAKKMINEIKNVGAATGSPTVSVGVKPGPGWFTLPHPAFQEFTPGKGSTPIYIRGEFEGPLRSILNKNEGIIYRGLMQLKAKTMSVIMFSPAIHNAVELGRAFPAMPGKFFKMQVYSTGKTAIDTPGMVQRAIKDGLVPIGHRGAMQDITSMMEEPFGPVGRSWTAKALAFGPGLASKKAGDTVKRGVDAAGDFWHNRLLWDQIAKLQMGLYVNFKNDMIKKGMPPDAAGIVAAHLANRYAGALPAEAMSQKARQVANLLMFSRTFTMGNLGVMKDMFNGLPLDVRAQLAKSGAAITPDALGVIQSAARRKAIATVLMDTMLAYVGNSILQDASNILRGDKSLSDVEQGYVERTHDLMNKMKEDPLHIIKHPFASVESLSSTAENEPGKQDRILVGYQADGTAIYGRNPVGKMGEEFVGWLTGPIDQFLRKEGTLARPVSQILTNDKGFGRKIQDKNPETTQEHFDNLVNIAKVFLEAQFPTGTFEAISDLATGAGDKNTNIAKIVGPLAGVTFSKGNPAGPVGGELQRSEEKQKYKLQQAAPELRKEVQRGNIDKVFDKLDELQASPEYQKAFIKSVLSPESRVSQRRLKNYERTATDERRVRLERAMDILNKRLGSAPVKSNDPWERAN